MHVRLGKNHGFKILLGPEPLGQLAAGCYSTASYALWKRHLCFHWSFSGTNEKQRCECIFLMWAFFLCDHRTKSSNFSFHPAEQTLQTLGFCIQRQRCSLLCAGTAATHLSSLILPRSVLDLPIQTVEQHSYTTPAGLPATGTEQQMGECCHRAPACTETCSAAGGTCSCASIQSSKPARTNLSAVVDLVIPSLTQILRIWTNTSHECQGCQAMPSTDDSTVWYPEPQNICSRALDLPSHVPVLLGYEMTAWPASPGVLQYHSLEQRWDQQDILFFKTVCIINSITALKSSLAGRTMQIYLEMDINWDLEEETERKETPKSNLDILGSKDWGWNTSGTMQQVFLYCVQRHPGCNNSH